MAEENTLSFSDLNLDPSILKVVNELGYETPTPIQQQSIPLLLTGRDVLGQAQTGTGKTAAFALPLLSQIDTKKFHPQLLILTPTRELALQVAEAIQTYSRHLKGCNVLPVYGGQNMAQQLRQLRRGVQVVVGTPGRIKDHLNRGTLKLNNIKATVIDEADEMLRMGFIDDVNEILSAAPDDRQSALFSATMPKEILGVARKHLKDPVEIRIKSKTSTVEKITQRYWQVKGMHKLDALTRILEAEAFDGMLIFVRTKVATVELSEKLEARGFSSSALNGDMTQMLREKTIERLKDGSLDIVVATDVVARGLDVQRISHVVNYDIPYDTESYVHRIGRTGRAGREGNAILFVAPREKRMLQAIERATKQTITAMSLPSRRDITSKRISQFKEQISEVLEAQDLEFFEELIDNIQSDYDIGHRRIAAAMAFLLQKERPLQIDESEMKDIPVAREEQSRPAGQRNNDGLTTYRVEVGRMHGVIPGNLVGALSNEGQVDSRSIGRINILERFTLIDLPADLSQDQLHKIRKIVVCNEQLEISPDSGSAGGNSRGYKRPAGNRSADNRKKPFKKTWPKSRPTRKD